MAELRYVDWDGLVYYDEKIKDYVDIKTSECLRIGGNVVFEELPRPSVSNVNYIYTITESFISNEDFEKPNLVYEAGTIVQVSNFNNVYLYTIFDESTGQVSNLNNTVEHLQKTKADIEYVDKKLESINPDNIKGLDAWIVTNRNSIAGLFSEIQARTLENMETELQETPKNIALGDSTNILVKNKNKTVILPVANSSLGVVKTSVSENRISVQPDGEMEVNSLNVTKLIQNAEDTLILNGGNSTK